MIILEEIIVVNLIAVVLMLFLIEYRRKNKRNIHRSDKIYTVMAIITLCGAVTETLSFLVDGTDMPAGRALNYITNSLSFFGTVTIGFLWCLFVDLRTYRNDKLTAKKVKIIIIPWLIEVAALIYNLFGTDIIFVISQDNLYHRGPYVAIGYVTLMIYFAYSIYDVSCSRKRALYLSFFPILYFIAPCLAGVVSQFIFYGITTSWISVALAMIFVQMQTDSENILVDALSGLYNRRYLSRVLAKKDIMNAKSLYGIMMDINDFKKINDTYGHGKGDQFISAMGEIIFRSISDGGMPIRYGGDEFVILLTDVTEESVEQTMRNIYDNIREFNESSNEEIRLSVSMGCTKRGENDDVDTFLTKMDEKMYEEKRKYHLNKDKACS